MNCECKKTFTLVNFGYDPWSRYWKRNQTMYFYLYNEPFIEKAYFVNTAVWIGDVIRDVRNEMSEPKINNWRAIVPRRLDKKNTVMTPVNLPGCGKVPFIQKIQSAYMRKIGKEKNLIVLINYPPSRYDILFQRLFCRAALRIFDWSDDYEQFSEDSDERRIIRERTQDVIAVSDIVIAINENLLERARSLNQNSYVVRNASNYYMFGKKSKRASIKLGGLKKPIVGYIGWLNRMRLDLELIEYVAARNPGFSFVFVGPKSHEKPLGDVIPKMSNVHIFGPVDCSELPGIMDQFDVCMLPNSVNEYTKGNDPLKIYDYLSSGRPIVSTRTSGVEQFLDFIYIADDKRTFNEKLAFAVSEHNQRVIAERVAVGLENSWVKRFQIFRDIVVEGICEKTGC